MLVGQVRVAAVVGAAGDALATEADRAAQRGLRGKNPMKAVQRAFVEQRVVLQGAGDARGHGAFRGAVRAVQEHDTVGSPLARKIAERAIDFGLH